MIKGIIYKIQECFLSVFSNIKLFKYPMFITYDPGTYKIKGEDYYDVRKYIRPGDILLRSYDGYVDGLFIPGKYSHAALYLGGPEEKIIHAMTPKVQYINLATFMRCDKLCVIRTELSPIEITDACDRAIAQLGKPYDYDFLIRGNEKETTKRFFCSELVYHAFRPYVDKLDWRFSIAKLLWMRKALFAPDSLLPTEWSRSEVIWEK